MEENKQNGFWPWATRQRGRIDFLISNFSDGHECSHHNDGDGNFTDVTFQAGTANRPIHSWDGAQYSWT